MVEKLREGEEHWTVALAFVYAVWLCLLVTLLSSGSGELEPLLRSLITIGQHLLVSHVRKQILLHSKLSFLWGRWTFEKGGGKLESAELSPQAT
jgi:hypothetical protein